MAIHSFSAISCLFWVDFIQSIVSGMNTTNQMKVNLLQGSPFPTICMYLPIRDFKSHPRLAKRRWKSHPKKLNLRYNHALEMEVWSLQSFKQSFLYLKSLFFNWITCNQCSQCEYVILLIIFLFESSMMTNMLTLKIFDLVKLIRKIKWGWQKVLNIDEGSCFKNENKSKAQACIPTHTDYDVIIYSIDVKHLEKCLTKLFNPFK